MVTQGAYLTVYQSVCGQRKTKKTLVNGKHLGLVLGQLVLVESLVKAVCVRDASQFVQL